MKPIEKKKQRSGIEKLAEQNYDRAQFNLGLLLEKSNRKDEALEWYKKAAVQGHKKSIAGIKRLEKK